MLLPGTNKRVCRLCHFNEQKAGRQSEMDFGDFRIVEQFKPTLAVRKNSEGQVIGWDQFFDYIRQQDEIAATELEQAQLVRRAIDKKVAQSQASYVVAASGAEITLTHTQTGEVTTVDVVTDGEKSKILGLPAELSLYMFNFTDKEIAEDTLDVIRVLITMHDARHNGKLEIVHEMPTEGEFVEKMESVTQIQTEDPSKKYDILDRLGQGGFAKVFKVSRKADGHICALKFVEPKNDKERKIIRNEVGLMQMYRDNGLILRVIEAFEFKGRLWIFVELMDDAMTAYVQNWFKSYSENICKYVLRKSAEALAYLHERNIIHRDIKSDNLLMNVQGDIKLADFGYACQLTQEI